MFNSGVFLMVLLKSNPDMLEETIANFFSIGLFFFEEQDSVSIVINKRTKLLEGIYKGNFRFSS